MKKIVKLTESDLTRIVKRVIKEDDEMEGSGSITIKDVFEEVVNALDQLGGYNESMEEQAMELARNIMHKMQDDLVYISENYEDDLYEILGDE